MPDVLEAAGLALRRYDGVAALSAYGDALEQSGEDAALAARAAAGRVRALWMQRRWEDALDQLRTLGDPNDSAAVALATAVVELGRPDDPAWLCVDSGSSFRDATAAKEAFDTALRLDEDSMEAVAGRATAVRMAGRPQEARQMLVGDVERPDATTPLLVEMAMCATELGDPATAMDLIDRAIDADPTSMHAQLVRLELMRRTDRGGSEPIHEVEKLLGAVGTPNSVLLESYGWALMDSAEAEPNLARRRGFARRAREQFRASMEIGPDLPGAVSGIVATYLAEDDFDTAREIAEEAIRREPTSPQLQRCRADIIAVAEGEPQAKLDAYRRVLVLDARDLFARIGAAHALADLDDLQSAEELVNQLTEELPGNQDVEEELALIAPWQSWVLRGRPGAGPLPPTRIRNPWENGMDQPQQVLRVLTDEVIRERHLTDDVAVRLRTGLESDRRAVLERAYVEEQEYLRRRDEHVAAIRHRRQRALWYRVGWVLLIAGVGAAVAGVGLLIWLLTDLSSLPVGWRWALSVAAPLLMMAVIWFLEDVLLLDTVEGALGATAVVVVAAFVWQAILMLDAGLGIVVGVAASAAVFALAGTGMVLVDEYGPSDSEAVQGAYDEWLESLYRKGVEPAATEAISRPGRVFGTTLTLHSRVVSDKIAEIETAASAELRRELSHARGSFALAGPRGAGKTALLDRWCAGSFLRDIDDRDAGGGDPEARDDSEARRDLSVKVAAPVGYRSQEFLGHLFARACAEVETYAVAHAAAIDERSVPASDRAITRPGPWRRVLVDYDPSRAHSSTTSSTDLIRRAREERARIRFILSRTTEGEASVGVSSTIGAKGKISVRRDELPLNHPELVDRFRRFLGTVAGVVGELHGKVLVGIDELDRISDGEAAQAFINELKAVFDIDNCYFLVSVSEDALAEFELAAMGMRTVFDSAFDRIVRVDYLSFDEARVLLHRRIIDLTEQFVALAYVVSGGLARQLCRAADEIGEERTAATRKLSAVTADLAGRQLHRTARAAMDRLSSAPDRASGAPLIPVLDEHPKGELTSGALRDYAARLESCDLGGDESPLVATTRLDLVVMTEFLAVLLDVFNETLDKERMELGRSGTIGDFVTLARARRYLGAYPLGARELLRAFSQVWKIEPITASEGG